MSLKDLLQLIDEGSFMVIDNDTALRTTVIDWWNPKDAQLKTLRDKRVRHIRLRGGILEIEVSA